jgi:hypothetical protein
MGRLEAHPTKVIYLLLWGGHPARRSSQNYLIFSDTYFNPSTYQEVKKFHPSFSSVSDVSPISGVLTFSP